MCLKIFVLWGIHFWNTFGLHIETFSVPFLSLTTGCIPVCITNKVKNILYSWVKNHLSQFQGHPQVSVLFCSRNRSISIWILLKIFWWPNFSDIFPLLLAVFGDKSLRLNFLSCIVWYKLILFMQPALIIWKAGRNHGFLWSCAFFTFFYKSFPHTTTVFNTNLI